MHDVVAAVEVGIVDQALPSDGCARLLEVDAHHYQNLVGNFIPELHEPLGIVASGGWIMDRAWSDNDDESVVFA